MLVVRTPNARFTGVRAGVRFEDGVGTCDALQAPTMVRLGYEVVENQSAEKGPQDANVLPSRPPVAGPPRERKPRSAKASKGAGA